MFLLLKYAATKSVHKNWNRRCYQKNRRLSFGFEVRKRHRHCVYAAGRNCKCDKHVSGTGSCLIGAFCPEKYPLHTKKIVCVWPVGVLTLQKDKNPWFQGLLKPIAQVGIKVWTGYNSEIGEIFPNLQICIPRSENLNIPRPGNTAHWAGNTHSWIWEYIFANQRIFPRFKNHSHFRPWYLTVQ